LCQLDISGPQPDVSSILILQKPIGNEQAAIVATGREVVGAKNCREARV
jgi:hypothetical protein